MEEMMDSKVVKLITQKVTETVVKEATEWKSAYEQFQKQQTELAKVAERQRNKRIGFRF